MPVERFLQMKTQLVKKVFMIFAPSNRMCFRFSCLWIVDWKRSI